MNRFIPAALLLAMTGWTGCAANALTARPVKSASGQFSARVLPEPVWAPRMTPPPDAGYIKLDPTLLTISADRIRQYLCRELRHSRAWSGQIALGIRRFNSLEKPITVEATHFPRGWRYQVELPDVIRRDRLVQTLVEVNLLELANGDRAGRSAEIPLWLSEGLTAVLLASHSLEVILPPPQWRVNAVNITPAVVQTIRWQPLAEAHAILQTNAPLSLEQLSWPTPDQLQGAHGATYRSCAHLLVSELMRLPNGRDGLRSFTQHLGDHYNWQLTLLEAFQPRFADLLALNKWWALQVAYFTGRDLNATWSYDESWARLNEVVHFPIAVRTSTNDLPLRAEATLQTVIRDWDFEKQDAALRAAVRQLAMLRLRIAPEFVALVDGYRLALGRYLGERDKTGLPLMKGANRQASLIQVMRRATRELNRLDAELAFLQPDTGTEIVAAAGPPEAKRANE